MKDRLKEWWNLKLLNWKYARERKRQEEHIRRCVPYGCRDCALLGICRDEQNDWKCRHGCMVASDSSKR